MQLSVPYSIHPSVPYFYIFGPKLSAGEDMVNSYEKLLKGERSLGVLVACAINLTDAYETLESHYRQLTEDPDREYREFHSLRGIYKIRGTYKTFCLGKHGTVKEYGQLRDRVKSLRYDAFKGLQKIAVRQAREVVPAPLFVAGVGFCVASVGLAMWLLSR